MTNTEHTFPNVVTLEAAREQIHLNQVERALDQKEALAESLELRQTLGHVAELRGREIDTSYQDFEAMRGAMKSVFDFRTRPDGSYGERIEAEENAKDFLGKCNEELKAKVYSLAEQFGLTGDSEPVNPDVKVAVVLGGAAKSPLDRTMYAKEFVDEDKLRPEFLVSLGSERPVTSDEIGRAGEFAIGAETEYDLLVKSAETAFGITIDDSNTYSWKDQSIDGAVPNVHKVAYVEANNQHPNIVIISSAIVTDPHMQVNVNGEKRTILRNRANTADTFATLGKMAGLVPGDKAVAITNAHFRPFQGAAAASQLSRYGVETDVVGFDPTHFGNVPKRTDELLQEMLTTADSLSKIDTDVQEIARKKVTHVAKLAGTTVLMGHVH